ncbi:hypothetical protein KR009_009394 [Drosophila setifemur]|nr:hypothetical protein KR009_009394 [Drosophila setifemur]
MPVESGDIPLISSSFKLIYKIASLAFVISPRKIILSAVSQKDYIHVLQEIQFTLSEAVFVQKPKNHCATVMESKVNKNLATTAGTVSTLTPLTCLGKSGSGKHIAGLPNNSKRQKLSTLVKPNSCQDDIVDNSKGDSHLDNNASIANKDFIDSKKSATSAIVMAIAEDSPEKKDPEKIETHDGDVYVAPEQALVTSVQLVVPAPKSSSTEDTRLDLGESSLASSSAIDCKLQFVAADLYSSSGSCDSTKILSNDKIDGCANDSSNLNLRIPTNLVLTTDTGDILVTDRRTSIWAPHNEHSGQMQEQMAAAPDDIKPETLNAGTDPVYQQQKRHSELLLQVEKDNCRTTSFAQAHPFPSQHHNITDAHRQYEQTEGPPIIESELHNNLYAQMIQQHHIHESQRAHQQQESMHVHSPRNQLHTNYAIYNPHFQNSPIFATHDGDHHHRQQHQPLTHIMEYQHQQQHHQQQHHQQQQHQPHHQQLQHQQMHDNYHDLMMEDFHDEPSSAFKLTLSPNIAKPENQDDGYETSAGDVLTPNSHSSSTHSLTPQHQMQHLNIGLIHQNHKKGDVPSSDPGSNGDQDPVSAPQPHLEGVGSQATSVDPYSFMDHETRLRSPTNTNIEMVGAPSASYSTRPVLVPNESSECSSGNIYQHQHHSTHDLEAIDSSQCGMPSQPTPKKRGRKKKLATESTDASIEMLKVISQQNNAVSEDVNADLLQTLRPKERKKHDRFNGMSEEEVIKRTIPDHLCENLDIVIVGINPGLFAAYKGHHYAGPGNHFWKCLYMAGLTQEQMSAEEDYKLLKHGIGFTNMVARATKGSADLTRKEIKEGSRILLEKLQSFRPKVAVFNGKLIFEVFSGKKEFHFGRQPDRVDGTDTYIWVMPSSSARCAQLPRAADKVPFYAALKKFRDFLNGLIPHMDESECVFTDQRIRQCTEQPQTECSEKERQPHQVSLADRQSATAFIENNSALAVDGVNPLSGTEGPSQFPSEKCMTHVTSNVASVLSTTEHGSFPYTGGNSPMLTVSNPNSVTVSESSYLSVFGQQQTLSQQPQEKKKRGRPKKIKGQEIIDHTTGTPIVLAGHQMPHPDFNNILNLSMISGGSNTDTPKKKRGRPKKLKPTIDNIMTVKPIHNHANTNPNSQSTGLTVSSGHSISMEHIAASPQSNHQMPPSLYNTPPPSHILYTASASPMASPALNCNYAQVLSHATPPIGQAASISRGTPPIIDSQNEQLLSQKQSQPRSLEVGLDMRDQPNLGETPPPNSPNICTAVDFDPPEQSESQGCPEEQTHARELVHQSQTVDKIRYESPAHAVEVHPQEHFQQWLSPLAHQSHHPIQKLVTQQLSQSIIPFHQEQSEHWQRYEDQNSNPYVLISAHHQHLNPQLSNQSQPNPNHSGHIGSDVARKSLSGLESLVDQIPAMREHEPSGIPTVSAAAAAAAVESRLLGLQQQQQLQQKSHIEPQVQLTSCRSTKENSNVINNSFSVSSLAASASTVTTDNDTIYSKSDEIRGNSEINNTTNNCSNSVEYPIHSPSGYPHHTHLISSALGVSINASDPNQHPIPHAHGHGPSHPMYMDHAHITNHMSHIPSVNVNSVYGPTAYGTHPQHNAGDYGATHGHYNLGSPVPATGPGSTTTLHMPSPNYPYGHHPYSHTPTQANYPSFAHPHTHHHSHHSHPSHHLSVFERFKPSDIGGYGGF